MTDDAKDALIASLIAERDQLLQLTAHQSQTIARLTQQNAVLSALAPKQLCQDSLGLELCLSVLGLKLLVGARMVCRAWRDAVRSLFPLQELFVASASVASRLQDIAAAVPNLQCLKYHPDRDGSEDFVVDDALFAHSTCFEQLTHLTACRLMIRSASSVLQMQHLTHLTLGWNKQCAWDLGDLAALPHLVSLDCHQNHQLTGSLSSLGHLSTKLRVCLLLCCYKVTGDLSDLCDFVSLKQLDVNETAVRGDVSELGPGDLSSLEQCAVSESGTTLHKIADAEPVMAALHRVSKTHPRLPLPRARDRQRRSSQRPHRLRGTRVLWTRTQNNRPSRPQIAPRAAFPTE